MLFTSSYFHSSLALYVLATCTYIYCRLILLWKNYLMEFTPPVTVYIHSLFQLLYHLFLSQTADPPLSKATKVARLQLAYKFGSSSSQRALLQCCWVLWVTHLPFDFPISVISHFPFPISVISHFPFPISSFLVPGFTSSRPEFSVVRGGQRKGHTKSRNGEMRNGNEETKKWLWIHVLKSFMWIALSTSFRVK